MNERRYHGLPRYLEKTLAELQHRQLPTGIIHVNVRHDDNCPFLNGTGECACDPDIECALPGVN